MAVTDRAAHSIGQCRTVAVKLCHESARPKREDAAVPTIASMRKKFRRAGRIGLLDETFHGKPAVQHFALQDIAIACFWMGGCYAKGNKMILFRQHGGSLRRHAECDDITNVVIAGTHQHHRILWQQYGSQRDSGSGILRLWLHHDARVISAKLRRDMFEMRVAGDDERCGKLPGIAAPRQRLLEQGLVTHQRQEGFGLYLATAGPQAGAAAAAHNNWMNHGHVLHL